MPVEIVDGAMRSGVGASASDAGKSAKKLSDHAFYDHAVIVDDDRPA